MGQRGCTSAMAVPSATSAARPGRDRGLPGEGNQTETSSPTHRLPDAPQDLPLRKVPANQATAVARGARSGPVRREFVTEQVFYTSQDGTRVPMYITHRREW